MGLITFSAGCPIRIIVGHGPAVLAVGAGGVVGYFYSRLSYVFSVSLSLSLGDGPSDID